MLARLILALLLVLGAAPSAAMPVGCHDGPAMTAMAMPATHRQGPRHDVPARPDHGCIGCAALGDLAAAPAAAPLLASAMAPIAAPARLAAGSAAAPTLRPPRIG